MSGRWLKAFDSFTSGLRVRSKEHISTDPRGVPLKPWMSQRLFLEQLAGALDDGIHQCYWLKSRQLGCCLDPSTRVLTADLKWVPIGEIAPGTEIVAVDERNDFGRGHHRKMRLGVVEAVVKVWRRAYRITLDDGRTIVCTGQHPWLSRKASDVTTKWRHIEAPYRGGLNVGSKIRKITMPWGEPTVEDGWFGGMLDGEGCMSQKKNSGASINVSQKPGPVWDRLCAYAEARGYNPTIEGDASYRPSKFGKTPVPKLVFSRMDEVFRLIGQTRPTRFIDRRFWVDRELPGKKIPGRAWATITKIEPLGYQTMIDLQTSRGTYIAEGLVSHNTTISVALVDVFWPAMHPGLIGALVTDTEQNRDANRAMIKNYVESFRENVDDSFFITADNRSYIEYSNGSRINFLLAGTKKKSIAWAEGQGYVSVHATEPGKYGDAAGLESLMEAMPQTNPNRLLVIEGTANGFNHWRNIWLSAKDDPYTKRAFFIGWWASDVNRIERSDPRFHVFGRGALTPEERELVAKVKSDYGHEITPEQLAWIRWKENGPDEGGILAQNQPWIPEQAFIMTGYSFFNTRQIAGDLDTIEKDVTGAEYGYQAYRYTYGNSVFDLNMEFLDPADDHDPSAFELRVWEDPVDNGVYVIGCDPAYGRNEHKDRHGIEVWRCYADCLVQVAEYATNDVETKHAAWVLAHLAGAYKNCMVNVEIGGPGRLIMLEWDHIRQLMETEMGQAHERSKNWQDALSLARWFLYQKVDSPGAGYVYNYEATWRTKQELMHAYKGSFLTRELVIRSIPLLSEMALVVQDGNEIGAPESRDENCKDDRVIASALANMAWIRWRRPEMMAQNLTLERVRQQESGEETVRAAGLNGQVFRFFQKVQAVEENPPSTVPVWKAQRGLM